MLDGKGALEDGSQPDASLNGEFLMPTAFRIGGAGVHCLVIGIGNAPPTPEGIASLAAQLSRCFRHVVLAARVNDLSAPWLAECIRHSDLAYLFLQASKEGVRNLQEITRHVQARHGTRKHQVKAIGCFAPGDLLAGFDMLDKRTAASIHMFVRGCPTSAGGQAEAAGTNSFFAADVRRLAREVSGRLVGLALSSGAAKGYAHIGVIQVLEENGIEVDMIAGSSMGAYIGSLWAYGIPGTALETIAREMEKKWALWSLIDPVFPPRQGFLRGFAVKKRLMRSIGDARFADLQRPMRIIAGNLATLERMVFCDGQVAAAVHASSAVPGICVPVTIEGETYVDGAVVDPLPVEVLREMGASRVIAVNVIPTPARIRSGLDGGKEPRRHRGFGLRKLLRKLLPVNQELNYFARANILEILLRSNYGAQIRIAEASCLQADIVLRPEIWDDRWVDCAKPGRFIALGREAAQRHLEELKALVASREDTNELKLAPEPMAAVA